MATNLEYTVEYRQVNINVGDCSFILLVQNEQGKDPIIKRAVMIDGGDRGDIRVKNIKRVMERIGEKYKLPKGQFKLDAMVITHWDRDHYFGVLKLLDDDLMSTNTSQVSFLKYDLTSGDPLSFLYIPYADSKRARASYKINYSPSPPTGTGEFVLTTSDGRRTRICKYLADMPPQKDSVLNSNPKELATGDISELIGRDLFTNYRPTLAEVVSAADPKKLVKAHNATMPGLYCVAANNRYLKGGKTSDDLKNGGTPTNRSSIVCMIIRKDGMTSHYLAGDAYQDLEAKVIDWTGLEPLDPAKPPSGTLTLQERIAIVKASHHGAATSTPITFCQTYKPMYFIFSSGNKHRHPTWETLLYVYSYYISPLGNSISPRKGTRFQIYTTSFPYWIDDPKVKDRDLFNDEDPLTKTTPEAIAYRTTIASFFDASTANLNLVHKFQNDPTNGDMTRKGVKVAQRATWIRRHVQGVILTKFSLLNDPKCTTLPSTSANESELDSRVSSIRFMSYDDKNDIEVDLIGVDVNSMPSRSKRSNSVTPQGGCPKRKYDPDSKSDGEDESPIPIISKDNVNPPSSGHVPESDVEGPPVISTDSTDKKLYLMSSKVTADPNSSDSSIYIPDSWDLFVSTLSDGFITLVHELDSTSKTVDLYEQDEWQVWLASAMSPSEVQISMTGSVKDEVLTIDYFGLTVDEATFGPARKVGPTSDSKFDPATDFLRFDIADSSLGSITFGDLYDFFDVGGDSISFASNIALDLDMNSAVWFSPLLGNYTSAFRIQASAAFKPADAPATVSFLKSVSDLGLWDEITPSKVTGIAKKTTTTVYFESPRENDTIPEIILSFDFPSFSTTISCGENSYTLAIYWKSGVLDAIVKFLKNLTGSDDDSGIFKEMVNKVSSTDDMDILRVLVELHRDDKDSKLSLGKISIDAQLKFKIGKAPSETKNVIFMLSFVWPDLIFRGNLYVPDTVDNSWRKLLPSYEELLEVKPTVEPSEIASNLSLTYLIPGVTISTPPQGIPTVISSAEIEVDRSSFTLQGVMKAVPPSSKKTELPLVSFDSLDISISYQWDSKTPSLHVAAVINLHPKSPENTDPDTSDGFLFASVDYKDKEWALTGSLMDINFGYLHVFFNADEKDQMTDVLGNVTIRSLFINCEFGEGEPTQFQFEGTIEIAALELDFAYNRDSNGWSIEGGLSAAKECTVADVIHSICGDDAKDFDIPDFIGDVKLNVQHDPESHEVPQDSPVYLKCSKPSSKDAPMVFMFRLTLSKIQLSFIQISSQQPISDATDIPVKKKRTKKRIMMFTLGDFLPSFHIPVIGDIDNPVDGLEFVWVQDKSKTAGLTRAEVEEINSAVFAQQTGIVFKELKASGATAQTNIVLTAGCHFMLLVKDSGKITAALDYKFGAPKMRDRKNDSAEKYSAKKYSAKEDSEKDLEDSEKVSEDSDREDSEKEESTEEESENDDPPADSNAGGMSKAAVHKTIGPLSVANIGLQYKDSTIIIILDATLTLGPIGVTLLGFGLGVKLTSTLFSNFELADLSVQLRGLAAAFDKPPIILAGLFEDLSTPTMELFAGGIAVSMKEYSFLALGSYGVVTDRSGEKFKTFFLFAQLHGPLVELEFGTINGVSLGFGYNSHVKYPNVDEILSFPLVKGIDTDSVNAADSSSDVLSILSDDTFTKWVTPQNGSLWFAAGLEVLAFETLDVRAVAIIEIDPFVSIGLFADAVCSLPPMVPLDVCYLYVELGITCRVDIRYGNFSVEGKLSPNSFVLRPSCHLHGGFALYYWFDPSPYAGEFVFTVGGYHPAYKPPSYYPRPQRLTITWQLDSTISITGEAFFAITPKVCMGGGSLSILLQSGALRAHLDAHASFLMVWNPFHFMGDIGVSIHVGFHGKFLFWTYNIETDISASLHLEGPPFGGNVHVDFWLFGFDIYFGSHPDPPPPLSLDEFWTLLSRSNNQPDTGHDAGITLVVESGYAQGKSKQVTPKAGQPWIVAAGQFKFNIQCRFALHSVEYNSESSMENVCKSKILIYSKPMHTTEPIESSLKITIFDRQTSKNAGGFTFRPLTKNVPSAMWGKYDSANDPSHGATPDDLLDGNNSTIKDVLTGMHVIAPAPEYPDDDIPPFNAHDAMSVEIIKDERFPAQHPSSQSNAWLPTTTTLEGAKSAWSSHEETSKEVATELAKVFGWMNTLVGSPPARLVNKLDKVYLSVPRITIA